jgi:hypothetical protein
MHQDEANPRIAGRGRLVVAREELAGINSRLHPRLGPIGRFLLHPTAVEPLCDITATRPNQNLRDAVDVFEYGTRECPASVYDVGKAEVADLRAEINNWNLINGLHLSGRQIEEIVEIYDAAEARVKGLDRPAEGRTRSMLVGRRAKGERIKPRVVRAAVERAVEQILNPGQRQVLVDYKACLIPPKNLKNPVRVGQASDHAPLERWLGRARKTPAGRRQKLIDTLLEKEAERFGELNPVERQQRVGLLLETVRGAAEMTETEFELDKAELAEGIAPRDRVGELKREIGVLSRQEGLPGKVAQFMLKPGFIEQLRRRDRQLAVGVVAERANLAGGPRAENCAKGCAVKPKGKKGRRRAS